MLWLKEWIKLKLTKIKSPCSSAEPCAAVEDYIFLEITSWKLSAQLIFLELKGKKSIPKKIII